MINIKVTSKNMKQVSKKTNGKDTSIIPKGIYCYTLTSEIGPYGIPKAKYCPYMTSKNYDGVNVTYCDYLGCGSVDNGLTEKEYQKLIKYFGSKEKMYKELPLSILWDDCKECEENIEDTD